MRPTPPAPTLRWDLFCRVIDNLGDAGVCWRLAADLAARGQTVRLWIDEPAPLGHIAPAGAPGVQVIPWTSTPPVVEPGDAVVEAFGCDPPPAFVQAMAAQRPAPAWVNLEYLSAEGYVERCHGLPSPQMAGPGRGLLKHFFYPGFTPHTGGLLREPGLIAACEAFDRDAWLVQQGWARLPGEEVVTLFCYDNPALPALLQALAMGPPRLLLAAQGAASHQVQRLLGAGLRSGSLRAVALPWLTQADFDRALWCADLNFVRGEDSFVRAQWAGAPFVWQIYPQDDGAHVSKLQAFLDRFLAGAPARVAGPVTAVWRTWNGLAPAGLAPALPRGRGWRTQAQAWRGQLLAQDDLVTQLLAFVLAQSGRPAEAG
ncbi:hypothetical protein, PP_1857 family [Burkholderiales bacterium JOSHI_001]|nr:hypothetical protein, PP_1857 family [Burkholderiales bacterium JOSHI_001]